MQFCIFYDDARKTALGRVISQRLLNGRGNQGWLCTQAQPYFRKFLHTSHDIAKSIFDGFNSCNEDDLAEAEDLFLGEALIAECGDQIVVGMLLPLSDHLPEILVHPQTFRWGS